MLALDFGDELFHDGCDVIDIKPRAMKCAVRRNRTEQLGDRLQSTLSGRFFAFDDERGGAHASDHAVTAAIERGCSVYRVFVGCSSAGGKETGTDPLHQVIGGDVVGRHDDDAFAAALADPVFGDCHSLGTTCAGRIDLCVGPAGADFLGELRVAHGEHAEQEAPVEIELGLADQALDFRDAPINFVDAGTAAVAVVTEPVPQALEAFELFAVAAFRVVLVELFAESVHTREG